MEAVKLAELPTQAEVEVGLLITEGATFEAMVTVSVLILP